MEVLLKEDDLKKAVEEHLRPRMKYHDIEGVYIREVKVDNQKRIEVVATLKEKEGVQFDKEE